MLHRIDHTEAIEKSLYLRRYGEPYEAHCPCLRHCTFFKEVDGRLNLSTYHTKFDF